jgi:hypothetical protein
MRAVTRIDRGHVLLCNGGMERRWSSFDGALVSWCVGHPRRELLPAPTHAWTIALNGRRLTPFDFGELETSEACDEDFAQIEMRFVRPEVHGIYRAWLHHTRHVGFSSFEMKNCGTAPVTLTTWEAECLPRVGLTPEIIPAGGITVIRICLPFATVVLGAHREKMCPVVDSTRAALVWQGEEMLGTGMMFPKVFWGVVFPPSTDIAPLLEFAESYLT